MSQPAVGEVPAAPDVRLRMESGTVRATVSVPGEKARRQVVISVESCGNRLRRVANEALVRSQGWRKPFEAGYPPEIATLARAVAMEAGIWHTAREEVRATCSCPAGSGGCVHASAAVDKALGEFFGGNERALRMRGFDVWEWARSLEVTEAGVEPRRLQVCWGMRRKPTAPEPLGELPDLSAVPHLLDETLRRLRPSPFKEDVGEILRKGMLAAAERVGKAAGGGGPLIPAEFLDDVGLVLGSHCDVVSLFADDERGTARRRPGFGDPGDHGGSLGRLLADSLRRVTPKDLGRLGGFGRYWAMLFRYVERLTGQCALVPELVRGISHDTHRIIWRPATMLSAPLRAIHGRFVRACPPGLALLRVFDRRRDFAGASQETQVRHAIDLLFRGMLAKRTGCDPEEAVMGRFSGAPGAESLFFGDGAFAFHPGDGVTEEGFQGWLRRLAVPDRHPRVAARIAPDGENPEMIRVTLDFFGEDGKPAPPRDILSRQPTTWFLAALASLSKAVGRDVKAVAGEHARLSLTFPAQSHGRVVPRVISACHGPGTHLEIADALRSLDRPRLCYRMSAGGAPGAGALDLAALAELDRAVAVGDSLFPVDEFRAVVKDAKRTIGGGILQGFQPHRLAVRHVGGRYVALDGQFLYEDFRLHASDRTQPSHFELLRAALSREHAGREVFLHPSAERLFREILSPRDPPAPPGDLAGVLRPYQRTGFEWLAQNADVGFGSILADDMGLGKTVQAIALILHRTLRDPSHKTLVVAPAALLTNWAREIRRFAPSLRAQVYHGGVRELDLSRHDVVVSSHGVARRDTKTLGERTWGLMVVDEAQAIKNPATQQARAIKGYSADARVALTGTPVENHLEDCWSIFDYTNRGYLGSRQGFRAGLARPIERDRDEGALRRFHRLTGPFILRRLKTDRKVIRDLPEKIEGKRYCSLTPRQAALYRAMADSMMTEIAGAGDELDPRNIRRRGLILKMLTELKQVCNSPSHLLGRQTASPSESGKLALCLEILQELKDTGEKALVFTQYVEMGKLLVGAVRSETGEEPLFLHGGLARKARDGVVDTFQDDPARRNMVLSLKAGGTGLNLTAATQVIHFDRWWNPAVERQATDRAHRIGQTRRVQVHLLVTENTLEERIDAMLEDKKELAELTVRSGEKWLTDMTNRQLRELVELTRPLA